MKILVDSLVINHAWQHVMNSCPPDGSKDAAIDILASILRKEDRTENDVEKILDDLELKYLRLLERSRLPLYIDVVQDIQGLRTKLGLKSTTDNDITLEDEINQQLASYNPWHNPTDKPSDITDEDRKWADKEIEKHQDTPYLATEMIIDGLARQFDNKQAMDLIGRLDIAVYHLIQAKYSLSDNPEPDAEIDTAIKRIDLVIRELKREYGIVGFEPERRGEEQ